MLDLEAFDRGAMRDDAFQQGAQRRNIPLPVAQIVDQAALGLVRAGAEGLVKGAVGRRDVQVAVEDQQRAGNGLDNVAGGNIGYGFFLEEYRALAVVPSNCATADYAASMLLTEPCSCSSV